MSVCAIGSLRILADELFVNLRVRLALLTDLSLCSIPSSRTCLLMAQHILGAHAVVYSLMHCVVTASSAESLPAKAVVRLTVAGLRRSSSSGFSSKCEEPSGPLHGNSHCTVRGSRSLLIRTDRGLHMRAKTDCVH